MGNIIPRTIETINADIIKDIKARPALYDVADDSKLNSTSDVAVWSNLPFPFAVLSNILENLMLSQQKDLDIRKQRINPYTLEWYAYESLQYQHGDTVVPTDLTKFYIVQDATANDVRTYPLAVDYANYDPTKHIIFASSAFSDAGVISIKVAKDDGSGNPVALSVSELTGFQSFWLSKRPTGVAINVSSVAGDDMIVYAQIEVNEQLISSVNGESQQTAGTYPVEVAIKEYYKNLNYNGRFLLISLIDAIQNVDGVFNVTLTSVLVKATAGSSYSEIIGTTNGAYIADAGYIIEDSGLPLSSTLTYTAYVSG